MNLFHKQPIIGLLLTCLTFFTNAQNQCTIPSDEDLIRETINNYIEGRNNGDLERLRKAFLSTAVLKSVDPTTKELTKLSLEDYIAKHTPGRKQNPNTEITSLQYSGIAGVVSVVISYPTYVYYDYLVLLKVNDGWKIADKFYSRKNL